MRILHALALAAAVLTVSAQVCPPTEVVFLIDQSENAARGASTSSTPPYDFSYLNQALTRFLNDQRIVAAGNSFIVGAFGYSSGDPQVTIIPQGSSRTQALNNLNRLTQGTNAGSWTYRGLEMVQTGPTYSNNLLIVISSQGSQSTTRRNRAQNEIRRLIGLGWNPYVLAMQAVNAIDVQELRIVNGGNQPININDPNPAVSTDPKPYRFLSNRMVNIINNILCTSVPTTPTPATTTTTTTTRRPTTQRVTPRVTGLCSECLFDGGYGFDFDPEYCDSFYQCLPDSEPIRKLCPAGTFWDGAQCNFIDSVFCPTAVCDASTPANTRYPSGRCCNKYYQCNNGELLEIACQQGQIFDTNSATCQSVSDKTAVCEDAGRFECDVGLIGPIGINDCSGYAADVFGDPCYYQFSGYRLRVAQGTVWNQDRCTLDFSAVDLCAVTNYTQPFTGDVTPSDICNAVFLANFDGGSRNVFSERLNQQLDVYTILREARLTNNAITFTSTMQDPFIYYYFFNNRDLKSNTAFRLRFRLDNPQLNVEYDLLSNNYCSLCPETISFTVSATSNVRRVVTATFVTTQSQTVTTSGIIDTTGNDYIDMLVIFGETAVYGQLTSGSNTANINRVSKSEGANININRCGIQLGRGPNNNLVGAIDEFAVYEFCQDIDSLLR